MQGIGQPLANLSTNQIDAHKIMSTFGNDYISKTFRRLDKLRVHRTDRRQILLDNGIQRPPAFRNITPQAPDETNIVGRINEDLNVHLLEQPWFGEDQNSFDDYNRFRIDAGSVGQTRVRAKVVDRQFDRLAGPQFLQVINQQLVVESIGMIKVGLITIIQRHVLEIPVVQILLNEKHLVRAHRRKYAIRDRRLSRSGAT